MKRLYLTGNSSLFWILFGAQPIAGNPNPLPLSKATYACYNLVYLELAACRLTSLPENFSVLFPNVRVLNLNYNFLESDDLTKALGGLTRLRKLTVVGGRMRGTKGILRMLKGMGENVEMLDFRYDLCLDFAAGMRRRPRDI